MTTRELREMFKNFYKSKRSKNKIVLTEIKPKKKKYIVESESEFYPAINQDYLNSFDPDYDLCRIDIGIDDRPVYTWKLKGE